MSILDVIDQLSPTARHLWETADTAGRVALTLEISEAIRATLGDAKANIAAAILMEEALKVIN